MNALGRTLAARRHELVSKETREEAGAERGERYPKKETVQRGEKQTELGIRMLSHTANVRAQDGSAGGEGGR